MAELSAPPRLGRRSTAGIAFSAMLHAALVAAVASVVPARAERLHVPSEPRGEHLTFTPDVMPAVLIPATMVESAGITSDLAAPLPVPKEVAPAAQPVRARPVAAPDPVPEAPPPALLAAASLPVSAPPLDAPSLPPPAAAETPSPAPVRPRAVVGMFDARRESAARPVDARARPVAAAGFTGAEPVRAAAAEPGGVRPAGFDVRAAAADVPPAPRQLIDTPVAIVFKPEPRYSDEAKALRIEGQVVLEVEFAATGEVRVLSVVRGLGHGLDEAAARAAAQIRFRPAKAGGAAVDFRTTVHVQFRLS